ncbi:unnamed protein product [Nippostrongylus brasiliensis]|uniref:Reverse transcriptase domain-containing protein n=1 Tax=Nippostrongylus brasiliensis TaxID=27835 RepID=A0A0N4XN39_NIPBR|nr:unnamed protein product [Nippostrongylus brasiliensis]
MNEEYIRIDPTTISIPEHDQIVEPLPCSDYKMSKRGGVKSTSDYNVVLGEFKELLRNIKRQRKERPKLEPVLKMPKTAALIRRRAPPLALAMLILLSTRLEKIAYQISVRIVIVMVMMEKTLMSPIGVMWRR